MKLLPFSTKPAQEIEKIGHAGVGILHLIKNGGVSPNENPTDFQALQKKQQKFLLKLNIRIKELAQEQGIPIDKMRKKVMGGGVPEKAPTGNPEVEVVEDDAQLFDYLDEPTAELLFDLQEDKASLAIRAASLMLKYRVLYPMTAVDKVKKGASEFEVDSIHQVPVSGMQLSFSGETIEIVNCNDRGSGRFWLTVKPIQAGIDAGTAGFVCQSSSGNLMVGYSDWTEQDTRDSVPEQLIGMLYDFYQREAGISQGEGDEYQDEDGAEGNLMISSNDNPVTQ